MVFSPQSEPLRLGLRHYACALFTLHAYVNCVRPPAFFKQRMRREV